MGPRGEGRRLRVVVVMLALTAVGALGLAGSATGVSPTEALPDIVSDPPTGGALQVYVSSDTSAPRRLLLRFNGYVHNAGEGPLEIVGRSPVNLTMTQTVQRIYDTGGAFLREDTSLRPSMSFESADGHNHWHLRSAMRYSLYDATKSVEVAPSQKIGFCLIDSGRVETTGPPQPVYQLGSFCGQGKTTAPSVTMGISPGWRDVYGASVAFQWVDVSDVKPGTYWIASSSDPDNVIVESNESNNGVVFAGDPSIIPGYVAQPLNVSAIVAGQPRSVTLTAQAYGSGGERRFRIVTSPSQGTLNKPVGQVFDGPDVVYSPSASFSGSDSFTYEALDANSEFPRTPTRATVTLTGSSGLPTVSISGAPASMVAGTSVQLRAAVTGAPQTVEWSVNNVVGGAAATGTITPGGLYTAPMTPPANGSVIVRAASTNARAEVTIGITAQPVPVPAPAPPPAPAPTPSPSPSPAPAPPPTPPAPTSPPAAVSTPATVVTPAADSAAPTAALLPPRPIAKRKLAVLARPSLARRGSLLVIGTTSRKAGTVEVTAWKGSSRLGRCLARTPAARSLTCQIRVRSSLQVAGIRIAVRLLVKGKPVALRRATFTRQIAGPRTLALYRGSGLECWLPSPTR